MRRRRVWLAAALLGLVWLAVAAVLLLKVRSDASAGRDAADKARTESSPEDLVAARLPAVPLRSPSRTLVTWSTSLSRALRSGPTSPVDGP